jgi:hypothetical protein
MTEEELKLAYRFVLAVERIASAATAAMLEPAMPGVAPLPDVVMPDGAPTPPVLDAVKRARGRPRKDAAPANSVVTSDEKAALTAPLPQVAEPTEEERKAKFALLKAALQNCLALHGEAETRQRLKYSKFSEVPFDAIDSTIKSLEL